MSKPTIESLTRQIEKLSDSPVEPAEAGTRLFRVIEHQAEAGLGSKSHILAATATTRLALRYFEDTKSNRKDVVGPALAAGKRVTRWTTRQGEALLLVNDVEGVARGDQIMIDGELLVTGVDGAVMPAAELFLPGDLIAVIQEGNSLEARLIEPAEAS